MECWLAQSLSHDGSVHMHSRTRTVSGTQVIAWWLGLRGCSKYTCTQLDSKEQSHLPEDRYSAGSVLYT